jgi:hypothetical protein
MPFKRLVKMITTNAHKSFTAKRFSCDCFQTDVGHAPKIPPRLHKQQEKCSKNADARPGLVTVLACRISLEKMNAMRFQVQTVSLS